MQTGSFFLLSLVWTILHLVFNSAFSLENRVFSSNFANLVSTSTKWASHHYGLVLTISVVQAESVGGLENLCSLFVPISLTLQYILFVK